MITILKPTIGLHEGTCFRELLDIWAEREYCRVVPNVMLVSDPRIEETLRPESRPWMNAVNDILLYDNTVLDKLEHIEGWNKALFANEVKHAKNCYPWIFWPRFPKRYFSYLDNNEILGYNERKNESIFIGNYTTGKRMGDWGEHLSFFYMGSIQQNNMNFMKFDYGTYLKHLQNSKFGLCLPGTGPKCLRDVELIGLGTVPIFTPGVSTDYYDTLVQDKHFLYAETPDDVPKVIAECNKEKWDYMFNACLEWFDRNCSVRGSFRTTMDILYG
jgi:hypothetical protein